MFPLEPPTPNLQLPIASDSSDQLLIRNFDSRASRPESRPYGAGIAAATNMGASDWTPQKPFDLRERLFEFACLVVRVVQFLHTRGPVASALSYQLLRSGTSAGANYEEADDGSSDRDTAGKRKIVLRELKETKFRLRVLRRCAFLTRDQDPVIRESDELIKIVATLLRNSNA